MCQNILALTIAFRFKSNNFKLRKIIINSKFLNCFKILKNKKLDAFVTSIVQEYKKPCNKKILLKDTLKMIEEFQTAYQ